MFFQVQAATCPQKATQRGLIVPDILRAYPSEQTILKVWR